MTQEEINALKAQNAALIAEVNQAKAAARKVEYSEFLDGIVKEGKLLPALKHNVLAFMESLSTEQVVEFSEGTAKTSQPQAEAFKALLSASPKMVDFREVAHGDLPSEPQIDANAIAEQATRLQAELKAAGTDISFAEAITRTQKKGA